MHLFFAALIIVVIVLAVIVAHPMHRCPRCHGERMAKSRLTRRMVQCPRCHGHGRCYRRGAVFIHRFLWSLRDISRKDRQP